MNGYPAIVEQAATSLAAELNIPRGEVTIVRAERVDWPDSSLGCPEPGRAYLQVITSGYRVFLRAKGRDFEYHTSLRDLATRCPK